MHRRCRRRRRRKVESHQQPIHTLRVARFAQPLQALALGIIEQRLAEPALQRFGVHFEQRLAATAHCTSPGHTHTCAKSTKHQASAHTPRTRTAGPLRTGLLQELQHQLNAPGQTGNRHITRVLRRIPNARRHECVRLPTRVCDVAHGQRQLSTIGFHIACTGEKPKALEEKRVVEVEGEECQCHIPGRRKLVLKMPLTIATEASNVPRPVP